MYMDFGLSKSKVLEEPKTGETSSLWPSQGWTKLSFLHFLYDKLRIHSELSFQPMKNIWGKLLLIYNQILKKYRKYRIYWKRNEEWILWWGWEQRMVKWLVSIQYIYSKLSHEGISHIKKEQKGNQLNICHHFGTYFILPPIISYLLLMSLSLLIYNEFPGNKNSYRFILHYP